MVKKIKQLDWYFIGLIMLFICWFVIAGILFFSVKNENNRLNEMVEFECIREGYCVYVEYPNAYDGDINIPNYLLVYDDYVDKVIEVDIFDEYVYTKINVGDTILYVVDYDYTDADFMNVKKNN